MPQQFQMFRFQSLVTLFERGRENIPYAQPVASGFVHVGRADSFQRRTDLGLAFGSFGSRVDDPVGRQDQVRLFGDQQLALYVDAVGLQRGDLVGQDHRVDHDAVADDIDRSVAENPGRNRVEHVFFAFEMKGMSGVRPTLETGDHLIVGGQYVHHLSFTFVTPLQT